MPESIPIKFINNLKQKKFRAETGLFTAEGPKVVNDLIKNGYDITGLYALPVWAERNEALLRASGLRCNIINTATLARISNLSTPNEVLALCRQKIHTPDNSEVCKGWNLALDGISDPGNLGTIIRTAHWFNIRYIFCAEGTAELYSPKTVQASMGSLGAVKVIYGKLHELLLPYREKVQIAAACMAGTPLHDAPLEAQGIVVLGSESHGVSKEALGMAGLRLFIPHAHADHPDSLNVAVSTGIICNELFRRQLV